MHSSIFSKEKYMGKVVLVMSMSLDGFITASNPRLEAPMGDGGLVLHEWIMGDEHDVNRQFLEASIDQLGATICGRKTYDTSLPGWGADGPSGSARRPVFVMTHQAPNESPENGVYTFVTGGIEAALEQAQIAAGDKDVAVMGGANIGQQYLKAGLIDDIAIQLVPVLFGGGTRLFDHLGSEHRKLEPISVLETPIVTHLRYRVCR
jgi:dihydrofolate reductase